MTEQAEVERSWARRWLPTVLRFAVAIVLVTALVRSGSLEWAAFRRLLQSWPHVLAGVGVMLLLAVLTSWRLVILLRARDLNLTLADSVRLTLIGTFFNTCLPGAGGGDLVRMFYAVRGNAGRRTEVITVMLFDRVTGMFALIVWPILAAPFVLPLVRRLPVLAALLAAGAATALALIAVFAVGWFKDWHKSALVDRIEELRIGRVLKQVIETIASFRRHAGTVAAAVIISFGSHSAAIAAALLVAHAMNPEGFAWTMAILIPFGFMANQVPLTPGGLGVGEAAFESLFNMAGLSGGAEVMLGWRLLLLCVGLFGLVAYLRVRGQLIHAADIPTVPEDSPQATPLEG